MENKEEMRLVRKDRLPGMITLSRPRVGVRAWHRITYDNDGVSVPEHAAVDESWMSRYYRQPNQIEQAQQLLDQVGKWWGREAVDNIVWVTT